MRRRWLDGRETGDESCDADEADHSCPARDDRMTMRAPCPTVVMPNEDEHDKMRRPPQLMIPVALDGEPNAYAVAVVSTYLGARRKEERSQRRRLYADISAVLRAGEDKEANDEDFERAAAAVLKVARRGANKSRAAIGAACTAAKAEGDEHALASMTTLEQDERQLSSLELRLRIDTVTGRGGGRARPGGARDGRRSGGDPTAGKSRLRDALRYRVAKKRAVQNCERWSKGGYGDEQETSEQTARKEAGGREL